MSSETKISKTASSKATSSTSKAKTPKNPTLKQRREAAVVKKMPKLETIFAKKPIDKREDGTIPVIKKEPGTITLDSNMQEVIEISSDESTTGANKGKGKAVEISDNDNHGTNLAAHECDLSADKSSDDEPLCKRRRTSSSRKLDLHHLSSQVSVAYLCSNSVETHVNVNIYVYVHISCRFPHSETIGNS